MFLDAKGECDVCGEIAFFDRGTPYCFRHSALINDIEPEDVEALAKEIGDVPAIAETSKQPLGFVGAVTSTGEIPWEVHEIARDHEYRVSKRDDFVHSGQFVLEPDEPNVPFTEVEEVFDR